MNKSLTILHTNDLHGAYEQALRQAAYIKKRVRELKSNGESFLLVDGGDHMDMSINECLATEGRLDLEMLEETGYHAMAVGNNELLRSTPDQIRKLSLQSKVPWLLANLVEGDGRVIGGMKETLLFTASNGMRIGLFSATDQFGDLYENKHGFKNLDTLEAVTKAAGDLKENGADLIIFLSHLGYEADRKMAKEISGRVDVIIGAHTHTVLESPVVESGVLIVQAGSCGTYVGELSLSIDVNETGSHKIESYNGKLVEISPDSEPDHAMEAILEKGRKETEHFLSEVLFTTSEPVSNAGVIGLIADSLRDRWDSEIGLMYGGAALEGMEAGDVTKGAVLNSCKSMHSPVLMELKGEQIAGLIEDSYKNEITSKPVYGNGFRPHGIPIGSLSFSGVTWNDRNNTITNIRVNGEGLIEDRVYTVGTGSPMLYEEVCGYGSVKGNKLIEVGKTEMVKDVLMSYLKNLKTVHS
ncbi:bifunctional UDP-sugar hydrolase/5'-nucleotidase [Bacillus sp. P14.5]|uniref:bifunctional metallophosphatase/5'-nucleotidase n=1 Tax=Bacillus sp. P14.5 TaxID=1983400 RepID=UPI000DEADC8B|nr:bifunctional UDP-sugar hydrolase/5'-nucleotidase [Bacillus sp. P14.5]